jgi:hypothetical protein
MAKRKKEFNWSEFEVGGDVLQDYKEKENSLTNTDSNLWTQDFIMEVALGLESDKDILDRYGVSPVQYNQWLEHPLFKKELTELSKKIFDEGLTFKSKCKIQSEDYLTDLHLLMKSTHTPPNVKLEALRSLVKWAGLEPKEEKAGIIINNQVNSVQGLIQAVNNTSRDLVKPELKEIRAKSWRE